MPAIRKQATEVHALAGEADAAADRMHRAAERGRQSLVEAALSPAGLVTGALIVGAAAWLWPRRRTGASAMRSVMSAVQIGTVAWRLADRFLPAGSPRAATARAPVQTPPSGPGPAPR